MARILVFDARFANESGAGQEVDDDIRVDIFDATGLKEQRVLGPTPSTHIYETVDAAGILYTTNVDVSGYAYGDVTVKWYARLNEAAIQPYPFEESLPNVLEERLNSSEIKDYIRTMLGFPGVAIELTSDHYLKIMEETLSIYGQWVPRERVTFIDLVLGQNAYVLDIPSRGPFDVKFIRKEGVPLISDPLFGREYPRGQQLDFDQYVLGISFWEMLNRVTSQSPEWWWDQNSSTLYINIGGTNVAGASGNYYVMVRYFQSSQLHQVRSDHFWWFKRYSLAQAKKVLSQIRGKFSGTIPAPGGALTLNSRELMQEGIKEEDNLMAMLRGMAPSVPPVHG